jgi:pimeloyl-ACP methyl ester carboxylesterase
VRDYTYRAFSQIPRREFIKIWDGVVKGVHAEPDYHIAQPLLLMHGDDDRTGDIRRIAPLWAEREPNCTYRVIPNARHFAILDNPDFFNLILMEFLAKWVPVDTANN